MELIFSIIILVVAVILFGKIKGAPSPKEMTDEAIMGRLQLENSWIRRYQAIEKPNTGLTRQKDEKQRYIMELMFELNSRHGDQEKESLAPAMQRTYELVRQGVPEDKAQEQAIAEYVAERDARQAKAKDVQI